MPRFKLTVAYDGTDFHGWQKQEPPDGEPLRTAQGVLEEAVRVVVREPIKLLGASRTDTGVHAHGQVAAFSSETTVPDERMAMAINSRLPDDIQVRGMEVVSESFDPIRDCTSKGYQYRLVHGCHRGGLRPLFSRRFTSFSAYDLDVDAMNAAAEQCVGEHDFASFTKQDHGRESTVRTVLKCAVTAGEDRQLTLDVSGTGFLHNMIRIMMGTLVEVGRGKIGPDAIPQIIDAADRRAAGPTLSPEGLFLEWVEYGS